MGDQNDRVGQFVDEAKRLRYSRRQILRRGSLIGLSAPAIQTALAASGHVVSPRRAAAQSLSGKISILAGSYFVPEAQDFFDQQAKEWGSQNGVEVTTDYINWPDIQAKISA